MRTPFFPDVNVWLAFLNPSHPHHAAALRWWSGLPDEAFIVLCRTTQLGLLRLLTTRAAMGEGVLTQQQAWGLLDRLMKDWRVSVSLEPKDCWSLFRARTEREEVSPKHWADAYLAAFAISAGLQLVTFDRVLAASVPDAVLLTA